MLRVPFYHSLLKKYTALFGALFNEIKIERFDSSNVLQQTFTVPIAYGPREKFLARIEANPDGNLKTAIVLPRIGFELVGLTFDGPRHLQTMNKILSGTTVNGTNSYNRVYTPVPYNLKWELSIISKTTEDALRIVEQIVPYFTPEWTIKAKLLEDFDQTWDIPIVLDSIQPEDRYEAPFTERRYLSYKLSFTMKAFLFGPTTTAKIIKISKVTFVDYNTRQPLSRVTVQPGLDANGNPTTLLANTIPYSQIDEDDNYGYIVTIDVLPDE